MGGANMHSPHRFITEIQIAFVCNSQNPSILLTKSVPLYVDMRAGELGRAVRRGGRRYRGEPGGLCRAHKREGEGAASERQAAPRLELLAQPCGHEPPKLVRNSCTPPASRSLRGRRSLAGRAEDALMHDSTTPRLHWSCRDATSGRAVVVSWRRARGTCFCNSC